MKIASGEIMTPFALKFIPKQHGNVHRNNGFGMHTRSQTSRHFFHTSLNFVGTTKHKRSLKKNCVFIAEKFYLISDLQL
jgi:hypothetical protein